MVRFVYKWLLRNLSQRASKLFRVAYAIPLVVSPQTDRRGLSRTTDHIEITLFVFYPHEGDPVFVAHILYQIEVVYETKFSPEGKEWEECTNFSPKKAVKVINPTFSVGNEDEVIIENMLDGLLPEGTTPGFGPIRVEYIPPPPEAPRRGL